MDDEQREVFGARELGELSAKVDLLLKTVDDLSKKLENKYVPREEIAEKFAAVGGKVSELETRVSALEQAPRQRTAAVVATIACIAACASCASSWISLVLR